MLGLLAHLLDEPGTLDGLGETGIVLDLGGDGELAARLQPLAHDGLEVGARRVYGRGAAGRTRTQDQDLGVVRGHSKIIPLEKFPTLSWYNKNRRPDWQAGDCPQIGGGGYNAWPCSAR